ncbi:MAG: TonB-dependent receptor [Bryobacteraceae bacterium]|nr:TonB-dependent receptor [Bryobacteraceae bacterium]
MFRVLIALLFTFLIGLSAEPAYTVAGRLTDGSGAAVPGAAVRLRLRGTGAEVTDTATADGTFRFEVGRGEYELKAIAEGFAEHRQTVKAGAPTAASLDIRLRPATLSQEITVRATAVVGPEAALAAAPGAVAFIDAATLTQSRVLTIDEALRKATGVFARGEEGFGLRPNIGIRGLNPTRSSKVLLLEDGVPVSYAPYGDNASYYHPPVDRFDNIEVVKGSGQVLYGPSTVGGVINYLTPAPPDRSSGSVTIIGGNRDYLNGHVRWGTTIGRTGYLFDAMRKQGEGARENTRFGLTDLTGKVLRTVSPRQTLSLKANYYGEDSNLTYSGLRESEFLANPRGNPFRNDFVNFNRYGGAVTHTYVISPSVVAATNVYGQRFTRDWWRQSSNSNQRPNDSADPVCAGMANLFTTCGNEGRLRDYLTAGFEPRVRVSSNWFGVRNEMDFGFRGHFENQDRLQRNGDTPTARTGRLVESNQRKATAWSGFLQNRFVLGKFGITPGLRLEHVRFERANRLVNVQGKTDLTQWIPGIGVTYTPAAATTIYAGVHRGFSPPRAEDVINNTTGGTVELDPELSWNYEVGVRTRVDRIAALEATFFRLDFENQIIPASVAGGVGATLTSAGRTVHQGAEVGGRADYRNVFGSRHNLWFRAAYTWLPVAEFASTRFSTVPGSGSVRVTGNRLPYAPRHLLNSSVGYVHATGFNAMIEGVQTAGQFADDLNSINPSADGQRGRIPGNLLWNATINYPLEAWRTTLFVSAKNLGDRLYIVDRSRGVLPGMPRLVQVGLRFSF